MERVTFDYSKLAGKIREKFGTQKAFAEALGISEGTLSMKMVGSYYFTQAEMEKAIRLLDIEAGTVSEYFFTVKV